MGRRMATETGRAGMHAPLLCLLPVAAGLRRARTVQGFVAAAVADVAVAHVFQYLLGVFCASAAAAIQHKRCVFVGNAGGNQAGDLVVRYVVGAAEAACGKFLRGADIDPDGGCVRGGLVYAGGGGGLCGGGQGGGKQEEKRTGWREVHFSSVCGWGIVRKTADPTRCFRRFGQPRVAKGAECTENGGFRAVFQVA